MKWTSKTLGAALILAAFAATARPEDAKPGAGREQIGTVLGKPVYRDQLPAARREQADRLVGLFGGPLFAKYRRDHKGEITPTEDEIRQVTEHFDARHAEQMKAEGPALDEKLREIEEQLKDAGLPKEKRRALESRKEGIELEKSPPGREFSVFLLSNWKFQRHLYDRYGGGRVLWQQAGLEAFDATRVWLEACEKSDDLQINDAEHRAAFYSYWTRSHGPFLMKDEESIREEFLEPEWAPKTLEKSPPRKANEPRR